MVIRKKLKGTAPLFSLNVVLGSSEGQELDTGFEQKKLVKQDFSALWTNGEPASGILNNDCCSPQPGENLPFTKQRACGISLISLPERTEISFALPSYYRS